MRDAVAYLGVEMLKNLVLTAGVFECGSMDRVEVEAVRIHGLLVGKVASRILTARPAAEDAFVAGLLHGIGALVLAGNARRDELSPHAHVGAYLLGLWGLPARIVEAVAWQEQPLERLDSLGVPEAVYIADRLAHADGESVEARADVASVESWRAIHREQVETLGL